MPDTIPTRAEMREEIAEAVSEIAICLAQAIHEIDPDAHRRMNFSAGLAYNRLLDERRELAADLLYRFGRALMDRTLFPEPEEFGADDIDPHAGDADHVDAAEDVDAAPQDPAIPFDGRRPGEDRQNGGE